MSSFKDPVGSEPKTVYWRRRLVVLLGLVAVIVVVVLIVVRPGSSQGDPAKPASGSTSSAKPNASSASSASHTPSSAATTIPTGKAEVSGAACKASNVDVEALTDAATYAAGAKPQLTLSLTNTGAKPCRIDAGTSKQLFVITSGKEVYWKSSDCQTKPADTEIMLQPGKTLTSNPIAWDRTRSDPSTCTGTRTAVPAAGASYHLQTTVDGVPSKTTKQFILN